MENFLTYLASENFLEYVLWAMLAIVAIYVLHVLRGPSVWDRLMGMNLIATKTIMIIVVFAAINDIAFMLDLAILYALFGFIGTVFIALFLAKYRLGKIRMGKTQPKENKGGEA